jgi:hypothetical protein
MEKPPFRRGGFSSPVQTERRVASVDGVHCLPDDLDCSSDNAYFRSPAASRASLGSSRKVSKRKT